jgi:hypothetical protein
MPERETDPVSYCCGGFHYAVQQLCQKCNKDGYWVANLRKNRGYSTHIWLLQKGGYVG